MSNGQTELLAKFTKEGVPDAAELVECIGHFGQDATVGEIAECIKEHFESVEDPPQDCHRQFS